MNCPLTKQLLSAGAVVLVALLSTSAAGVTAPRKGTRPRRVSTDVLVGLQGAQRGTQAEPYLHVDPEDPTHLAAVWQENRYVAGSAQGHVSAVSFDGGREWSEVVVPGLTFDAGGRQRVGPWALTADPWLEFGAEGSLYVSSLVGDDGAPFTTAIVVNASDDGGLSWRKPVLVTQSIDPDFTDKNALTVDTIDGSEHAGNVYVAWDVNVLNAAGTAFERQDIYVARSTDGAISFEPARLVRTGAIGGGVIPRVGRKGWVYLMFTAEGIENRYAIYVTVSKNGGVSWKKPRRVTDIVGSSVEGVRDGFSLASFAADPASGQLFLAWQDSRSGVARILFSTSTSNGKRWSAPVDVVAAPADVPAFTPSVAVNGEGQVGVAYYSLQNDPLRAVMADYFVRVSEDAGESFDTTFRMTRRSFDLRDAARSSSGWFLGDYAGLVGTDKRFQALWISTRVDQQPDVWTAATR